MPRSNPQTAFGKHYPSLAAACLAFNRDPQLVAHRLKKNWPLEEALVTPPLSPSEAGKIGQQQRKEQKP